MTHTETVLSHSPIVKGNVAQQECWAMFSAEYKTLNGNSAYLTSGQFLPIWQRRKNNNWRAVTPFRLSVMSAFVIDGRYIIRGGNKNLDTHPEIWEWNNGETPVKGQAAELRFPGGLTNLTVGDEFITLANNDDNFESLKITAQRFHLNASSCVLLNGCPIEIVVRMDKAKLDLPFSAHSMYDVLRSEATTGFALPFPIIASAQEKVILKDYPDTWLDALYTFADHFQIEEIGVHYRYNGTGDVLESISKRRPREVYRNALRKGDLGFSTLDPELYERMLPFMKGDGHVDFEFFE